MMKQLPSKNPTQTNAWKSLQAHYNDIKDKHLKTLFKEDPDRGSSFNIEWNDFFIDYSKNRVDQTTINLLIELSKEVGLKESIDAYFEGKTINATEQRAVQHMALRNSSDPKILIDNENIIDDIKQVKQKIKGFTEKIINGSHKGYTGKKITDIVNIGIGGSDLGPVMITEALEFYKNHLKVHFISNVDGDHIHQNLKNYDPETTLFVIVSKTFTTQETLSNATTARSWFIENANEADVYKHFVAVSSNIPNVLDFGISEENIFPLWNWVGGRFSLWSAVGLTIALSVGFDQFEELLEGAHEMDTHFKETPFENNIPVILGLLSVWYNNFFQVQTEAIIPYSQYLHRLPAYLQQGIMESNGKSVDRDGNKIDYQTGTIIWGESGTNSQHAFFQLIHQGTKLIPTEFIGYKKPLFKDQSHHDKLMANFFAQTEALMNGKTSEEVLNELSKSDLNSTEVENLAPFKEFSGNKPTTTILGDKLTPKSLGSLVAMYEHRIFVQGIIWNIYSYDQWGVELGKQLAGNILKDIKEGKPKGHDSSTTGLLNHYLS